MGGGDIGKTLGNVTDSVGLTNYSGDRAMAAQQQATKDANATQLYMYNQTRSDNEPWRQTGVKALGQLNDPTQMQANFTQDPGYQFQLNEGLKAVQGSAAARGMGNSGAALKELNRYGQDYASNAYNTYYNRVANLAGIGQTANAQNQQAGTNYANNVSANQIGVGNAAAANQMGATNRLSGLISTAAGAYAGGAGGKALFSDERLKKNIKEIQKSDLEEMKSHLRAYAFNYINSDYGKGDWIGVMAQDLEKSKLGKILVVENEKGEKTIDQRKVLSLFLATMAEAA